MIPSKENITKAYNETAARISRNLQSIYDRLSQIPTYISQSPQFQAVSTRIHSYSQFAEDRLNSMSARFKRPESQPEPPLKRNVTTDLMHEVQGYFNEDIFTEYFSMPSAANQKDAHQGETIVDESKDSQDVFCKETAKRAHTMNIFKAQMREERQYLVKQLAVADHTREGEIITHIEEIDQKLAFHDQTDATWASTNTPRLLFKNFNREEAKRIGVPLLTNLRSHSVEFMVSGEKSSTNRSAAISDFAHSETNLAEMEHYLLLTDPLAHLNPFDFINYYKVNINDPNEKNNLIQAIKSRIEQAYAMPLDPEGIVKKIRERKDYLRTLMLQDLYIHFQEKPPSSQTLFYGRTALLDPNKASKIDSTGYFLSERNQLLDMKALYDELDGTKVLFDAQEGPYFDLNGQIHMPKHLSPKIEKAELRTLFFNICVQGDTKNEGLQRMVNQSALSKLKRMDLDPHQKKLASELEKLLFERKKTGFYASHKSIQLMNSLGYCSADCYGGKDRTGYALALESYYLIRKHFKAENRKLVGKGKLSKSQRVMMAKIAHQLIGPTAVARRIVEENSGPKITALKLRAFNLKLYITGPGLYWLKGIGKRLSEYLGGAALISPIKKKRTHVDNTILYNTKKVA